MEHQAKPFAANLSGSSSTRRPTGPLPSRLRPEGGKRSRCSLGKCVGWEKVSSPMPKQYYSRATAGWVMTRQRPICRHRQNTGWDRGAQLPNW